MAKDVFDRYVREVNEAYLRGMLRSIRIGRR